MAIEAVFECLSKWIALLNKYPSPVSIESLCTGHAFADVLHVIDPSYFKLDWRDSIKNVASENSHVGVKALALKKILKAVLAYSFEVCNQPIGLSIVPNVPKIACLNALSELVKFMQLIVASALHGPKGKEMIEAILTMEESIQQTIMLSIKELETNSRAYASEASIKEGSELIDRLGDSIFFDEDLALQCFNLETKYSECLMEKQAVENELNLLKGQLEHCESALQGVQKETTIRIQQLLSSQEELQLELERSENNRDVLSAEVEQLKKNIWNLQIKGGNECDDQTRRTRDEMDELRAKAAEAEKLVLLVEQLKKKLENVDDLKSQFRVLEEENAKLVAQNIESSEEQRKSLGRKVKLDSLKVKLEQAELEASRQADNAARLEVELRKMHEREAVVVEERDRLRLERASFQDNIEELQCRLYEITNASQPSSSIKCENADLETVMTLAADAPVEIKQKLVQLYQENRLLKLRLANDSKFGSDLDLSQSSAAKIAQSPDSQQSIREPSQFGKSEVELLRQELNKTNDRLEKCVKEKRESLEKARQIIIALNPVVNTSSHMSYSLSDIEGLKASLAEKENIIEVMQEEMDRMKIMYEQEQRLITTAFHELAWQAHRKSAEERLAFGMGEEPETFLSQQRQVQMTKLRNSN